MRTQRGERYFSSYLRSASVRPHGGMLYQPAPVIFFEGMQLFSDPRIRSMFDLRLWLEVDEETALARRLLRQNDYDVRYHRMVALPAQRAIVMPLRACAHEVIDGTRPISEVAACADRVLRKFLGV